jgi:hypothetical protein
MAGARNLDTRKILATFYTADVFMAYSTTLFVVVDMQRRMIRRLKKNELKPICQETVVA